ncbi:hypothetical protein BKA63DRAFT_505868 [Paraphoma chrysanthemicola]|nr:hypothetical protein BKA63DRAFT_505868 [Paraphoma chrysanthemicola]
MTIPDLTWTVTNNSFFVHYGTPITTTAIYNGSVLDAVQREDPCCGGCSIGVNALEVFYWPDQATAMPEDSRNMQSITLGPPNDKQFSFVDDTGFTFVSPSVYLVLSSLRARDKCGPVGQDISVTTMAFDANDISTIRASTWITQGCGWLGLAVTSSITSVPITFADLQGNCTTPNAPWMEWHPDNPWAHMNTADPCHPYIAIPTRVRALHPDWASCRALSVSGLYDPPQTLHPQQLLVPTTVLSSEANLPSITPIPGGGPPLLPGPTPSARATQTPSTSLSSSSVFWHPVPAPTATPAPSPVVVTLPPVGPSADVDIIITLFPTWIPEGPAVSPVVSPDTNQDPPQDDQIKPTAGLPSSSRASRLDPVPQDLMGFVSKQSTFALVVGTQTLKPGHVITVDGVTSTLSNLQSTIVDGVTIFLDVQNNFIVVGGSTTIPILASAVPRASPYILQLNGESYTADALGRFAVGTKTLIPGGFVMLDQITATLANGQTSASGGKLVYLDPQGTAVIIDGSTSSSLQRAQPTRSLRLTVVDGTTYTIPVSGPATIIIGGQTIDVPGAGQTVRGGRTITLPGEAATSGASSLLGSRGAEPGKATKSAIGASRHVDSAGPSAAPGGEIGGGRAASEAGKVDTRHLLIVPGIAGLVLFVIL